MNKIALTVSILRDDYRSSANKFNNEKQLVLISTDTVKVEGCKTEIDEDTNLVGIFLEAPTGTPIYRAFPVDAEGKKLKGWWMMGGSYIKTCDSRFPCQYPVMLMDRKEW